MRWKFATTSWTQILAAREGTSSESRRALESLCRAYWYPVYAFVRLQGHDAEESRDLTQTYFARLLEKGYIEDYDPSRGRFRVFLKTSVKNFPSKEGGRTRAQKRGGRLEFVSMDHTIEDRYRHEPVDRLTPEQVYERRWALTILERMMALLRREFSEAGRHAEFESLKGFLTGEEPRVPYADVAAALKISGGTVKVSVHRLRRRFGNLLSLARRPGKHGFSLGISTLRAGSRSMNRRVPQLATYRCASK